MHHSTSLMEQILSSDNLNRAYLQVVRNKGAEGVDGMKYTELKEHLEKNGESIKEQRIIFAILKKGVIYDPQKMLDDIKKFENAETVAA